MKNNPPFEIKWLGWYRKQGAVWQAQSVHTHIWELPLILLGFGAVHTPHIGGPNLCEVMCWSFNFNQEKYDTRIYTQKGVAFSYYYWHLYYFSPFFNKENGSCDMYI